MLSRFQWWRNSDEIIYLTCSFTLLIRLCTCLSPPLISLVSHLSFSTVLLGYVWSLNWFFLLWLWKTIGNCRNEFVFVGSWSCFIFSYQFLDSIPSTNSSSKFRRQQLSWNMMNCLAVEISVYLCCSDINLKSSLRRSYHFHWQADDCSRSNFMVLVSVRFKLIMLA